MLLLLHASQRDKWFYLWFCVRCENIWPKVWHAWPACSLTSLRLFRCSNESNVSNDSNIVGSSFGHVSKESCLNFFVSSWHCIENIDHIRTFVKEKQAATLFITLFCFINWKYKPSIAIILRFAALKRKIYTQKPERSKKEKGCQSREYQKIDSRKFIKYQNETIIDSIALSG